MCGRYSLATPDPAQLRARFAVGESLDRGAALQHRPGTDVLAVTTDREGAPRGEAAALGTGADLGQGHQDAASR